jgi:hypothetical protein
VTPEARQQAALIIGQQAIEIAEQRLELADLRRRLATAEAEAAQYRAELIAEPTPEETDGSRQGQALISPNPHDEPSASAA